MTTGSTILNNLFGEYSNITCVYGPAATGKTTIAILAAINESKKNKKKILFIDVENSFSPERAIQMGATTSILAHIILLRPQSLIDQEKCVTKIPRHQFSFIIIDTIGLHYRDAVRNHYQSANASIIQQLKFLQQMDVPVLITNQVYTNDTEIQQLGGKLLPEACNTIIELQAKEQRYAILHKPTQKKVSFKITAQGIV